MKKLIRKLRSRFYKQICYFNSNFDQIRKCKINGYSVFNGNETFGNNVNFNGCRVFGKGKVSFGNNFHSASGLKILTTFHNYNGMSIPYDNTVITKNVVIEDNVWIGMDVIILGGVTIGEGAIVQAGSVVVKSIPKYAICGGSPANVFSQRNIDHYEKLKKDNKFY